MSVNVTLGLPDRRASMKRSSVSVRQHHNYEDRETSALRLQAFAVLMVNPCGDAYADVDFAADRLGNWPA